MRYQDAAAFRQALEDRLRSRAPGAAARIARDRKRVIFDRFLARLNAVAPDRWLLKGGFALELRLVDRARATKDIDLAWREDHDDVTDILLDAADHDAGDFFSFIVQHAGPPDDRLGGSRRFRIAAALAGRPFDGFVLDVGFGPAPLEGADRLTTRDLLAFAQLQPVTVWAVPLENQVAEKLHAYTRIHPGSRTSTRVKDLVDLVLIAQSFALDAATLRNAIEVTFAGRDTHPAPATLPDPPRQWGTPFAALARDLDVPVDHHSGHATAAALLDPILTGAAQAAAWDPGTQTWSPAPPSR